MSIQGLTFGDLLDIIWIVEEAMTPNAKTAPQAAPTTSGALIRTAEAAQTCYLLVTLRHAGEIPHAVPRTRM